MRSSAERSERPRRAQKRLEPGVVAAIALWRMSSGVKVACGLGTRTRPTLAPCLAALRDEAPRVVRAERTALSAGGVLVLRTISKLAVRFPRVQNWEPGRGALDLEQTLAGGAQGCHKGRSMSQAQVHRLAAIGIALAAIALAGCGHPATVEECNTIIAKSAELELRAQNVTDPATIAQRTEAVKAARGEELLKKCVGKRITDRALACVARATAPKEVDACLR